MKQAANRNLMPYEIASLDSARTVAEMEQRVKRIKKLNGDSYPLDWGPVCMSTGGVFDRFERRTGKKYGGVIVGTGASFADALDDAAKKERP